MRSAFFLSRDAPETGAESKGVEGAESKGVEGAESKGVEGLRAREWCRRGCHKLRAPVPGAGWYRPWFG